MQSEEVVLNQQMLKQTLKEALVETFHEERDFLYTVVADVMEDFALTEAIHEGRKTELVSRETILSLIRQPGAEPQRIPGLFAGQIWISDDFDDPLPDAFWPVKNEPSL